MKKKIVSLSVLVMALFCIFSFASCTDDKDDHVHKYGSYVSDGNATCTRDGTKTARCSCGVKKTVADKGSAAHKYAELHREEATCTDSGYIFLECTVCRHTDTRLIEALGHDVASYVVIDATCTVNGLKSGFCDRCEENVEIVIEAKGHTPGETVSTGEKCGEQDIGTIYCTDCGEEILSLGHTYTTVKTQPTCNEAGSTVYTCTVCAYTYSEPINPYGHIASSEWTTAQEPTCTSVGVIERHCKLCDTVVELGNLPKKQHNYISSLGDRLITYTCLLCRHTYDEAYEVYYTVTLSTGDGTSFAPIQVTQGGRVNLPEPALAGYSFVNWYTEEDFITVFDEESAVLGDMTLYAAYAKTSERAESNTNSIFTDVGTDFTFKVITELTLTDDNIGDYITADSTGVSAPAFYISNNNGNEYTVASRDYAEGITYTVAIAEGLTFTHGAEREMWFTTARENTYEVEYKPGVVFLASEDIYSVFEKDGEFYIFLREDALNEGDTAVIYGDNTSDILSAVDVKAEGDVTGGAYVYRVEEVDSGSVFENVDVYYSGSLTGSEIEFSDNIDHIITEEMQSSALYKQIEKSSVIFASSVQTDGHSYKFKNIKISPTFSADQSGTNIYISVKITSQFDRIDAATGAKDGSLRVTFEVQSDLSFDVTLSASDYDRFSFNVDVNNTASFDLYVTSDTTDSTTNELAAFKSIFEAAKAEGEFSEVDGSTAAKENERVICSIKNYVNGILVGFDVSNVFGVDVVGQLGIDSTVEITSSYSIKNSPKKGLQTMKNFSAKADVGFCVMGKVEVYDMIQIDVYAIFLGIVNAHIDISAGPYFTAGGMFSYALYSSSNANPTAMGGYIQVGIKTAVTAGVNAKLQVFVSLFGKQINKKVNLFDKEWTIHSGRYPIFTLGDPKVALRFEKVDDDKTISYNCGEYFNISNLFDKTVLYQDLMTLKKSSEKASCTFYLSGYQKGVELSSLGVLKIDADGRKNMTVKIKVVAGDVYKEVTLTVNVNHTLYLAPASAPTCTEPGYTECQRCSVCEKIIEGSKDPVAPLGHSFTNFISNNDATCTQDGTMTAVCDRAGCNAVKTVGESGTALRHSYTNYIPDNNATCTDDGTKTAVCDRAGCGAVSTVYDIGSKIDHSYTLIYDESGHRNKCSMCGYEQANEAHIFDVPASCITETKCSKCDYTTLDPDNHESEEYLYETNSDGTHKKIYACCEELADGAEACSGGEADCKNYAKCSLCGGSYGETDPDNHVGEEFSIRYNGDGTHKKSYACCGAAVPGEEAVSCTLKDEANCRGGSVCIECGGNVYDPDNHVGEAGYSSNGDGTHTMRYNCCGAEMEGAEAESCIITEATCTSPDYCINCGYVSGEELDPDNHESDEYSYTYLGDGTHTKVYYCCGELTGGVVEDCTVNGVPNCRSSVRCTVCSGYVYDPDNHVIEAAYSSNGDGTHSLRYGCCGAEMDGAEAESCVAIEATCSSYESCAVCGYIMGKTLNPDNHESEEYNYYYLMNYNGTHVKSHSCCGAVANEAEACTMVGEATCIDYSECSKCHISMFDPDNHASDEFIYRQNGDGTHSLRYGCCGDEIEGAEAEPCIMEGEATCSSAATCTVCYYYVYDSSTHSSEDYTYRSNGNGTHRRRYSCCGAAVPGAEAESCVITEATCTSPDYCIECAYVIGQELDPDNHARDTYYYINNNDGTHKKKYYCCGGVADEAEVCTMEGEATCSTSARCSLCGYYYNDSTKHSRDEYYYSSNSDGTHKKKYYCCGAVADAAEACTYDREPSCSYGGRCTACRYYCYDYTNHTSSEYTYYGGINEAGSYNGTHYKYYACCEELAGEAEACTYDGEVNCSQGAECTICGSYFYDRTKHASDEYRYKYNSDGTHLYVYTCCNKPVEGAEAEVCTIEAATCCSAERCSVCGHQFGWAYDYNNHASDESSYYTNNDGTHVKEYLCCSWGEEEVCTAAGGANCQEESVCTICGGIAYNYENHVSEEYYYDRISNGIHGKVYTCCGAVDPGSEEACTLDGEATCSSRALCTVCYCDSYDYTKHDDNYLHYSRNDDGTHSVECGACYAEINVEDCLLGAPTCIGAVICTLCGQGYYTGEYDSDNHIDTGYSYINIGDGTHIIGYDCCGVLKEGAEPEEHTVVAATCISPEKCSLCNAYLGDEYDYENHASDEFYCYPNYDGTHEKEYYCCYRASDAESCYGGEANCRGEARCSECGAEYYADPDYTNHASDEYYYVSVGYGIHALFFACCGTNDYSATDLCYGGEATCVDPAVCEACGCYYGETSDEHLFTNYVPNGDADVGVDGTKTAICDRQGCYAYHTIVDEGSALELGELAFELNSDGLAYTVSGIGSYNANEIIIPESYNGIPVTAIGASAFTENTNITGVVIPDGIISIGNLAFYGCTGITSLNIPESVISIGYSAFWNCIGIQDLAIPAGLTSIGNWAFCYMTLTSITVAEENTAYKSVGDCLIETASGALLVGSSNSVIPTDGSITSIGDYAFFGCADFSVSEIPYGVISIGENAFDGCTSITSLYIPETVTNIGEGAFQRCSNLEAVVIPEGITSLDNYLFCLCQSLTSVTIPSGVTSIGDYAFAACTELVSVSFAENCALESIGEYAFGECGKLPAFEIPAGVTSIGNVVFCNCDSLTSLTVASGNSVYHSEGNCVIATDSGVLTIGCGASIIPTDGSVTAIGDYAFYRCFVLESVTIPSSVVTIGYVAFDSCISLKTVVFEENSSLESIGEWAFEYCSAIEAIEIPASVTTIGRGAFMDCSSLKYCVIADNSSLTELGIGAFARCYQLTEISFGENSRLAAIGAAAFYECNSLTNITIPSSLTAIADEAFAYCYALVSIIFEGSAEGWSNITKGVNWDLGTGLYKVYLSDGTVLSGGSNNETDEGSSGWG